MQEDQKLYYTISEVSEKLGVSNSLLRFWEKTFALTPRKNSRGNRIYTSADIDKLSHIHHLVKEKGMTLPGAKELLEKQKSKAGGDQEAVQTLKKLRLFLTELKDQLDQ